MVFVKVVKNNAYYKRFQVKFRRRREGKTDYRARKFLTFQQKNKYNTPKYRFVVRLTNKDIIAQIVSPSVLGDQIVCHAQSKELVKYGLNAGLTNYSAAYATGLLLARRLLSKFKLDSVYQGISKITGQAFDVYKDMEKRQTAGEDIKQRPFKAFLDVGLTRTTTGNKVFGALKGATDGGLHVPHSVKRFPGSKKEDGRWKYDAEVHRKRIFGLHVESYLKKLSEEDPEKLNKQFGLWVKSGAIGKIEALYKSVFDAIRKNPSFEKKSRTHKPVATRVGDNIKTHNAEYPKPHKLTNKQRKDRVKQKIIRAKAQ
jgi:large subunit ribosomal protein L5e